MKKRNITTAILMLLCTFFIACSKESDDNEGYAIYKDGENETETEIEKSSNNDEYDPYTIYLEQKENTHNYFMTDDETPECVGEAIQTYICCAFRCMESGSMPDEYTNVIKDLFVYKSYGEGGLDNYMNAYYRNCKCVPVGNTDVYPGFTTSDYLLDYIINDDYNEEDETFTGKAFFQFDIIDLSGDEFRFVKTEQVCIGFKMKYAREKYADEGNCPLMYRVIEIDYLSSENECNNSGKDSNYSDNDYRYEDDNYSVGYKMMIPNNFEDNGTYDKTNFFVDDKDTRLIWSGAKATDANISSGTPYFENGEVYYQERERCIRDGNYEIKNSKVNNSYCCIAYENGGDIYYEAYHFDEELMYGFSIVCSQEDKDYYDKMISDLTSYVIEDEGVEK